MIKKNKLYQWCDIGLMNFLVNLLMSRYEFDFLLNLAFILFFLYLISIPKNNFYNLLLLFYK